MNLLCCSYGAENVIRVYTFGPASSGMFVLSYTFGGFGSGPAKFNVPTKMCFTRQRRLVVCDTGNDRVQVLTVKVPWGA